MMVFVAFAKNGSRIVSVEASERFARIARTFNRTTAELESVICETFSFLGLSAVVSTCEGKTNEWRKHTRRHPQRLRTQTQQRRARAKRPEVNQGQPGSRGLSFRSRNRSDRGHAAQVQEFSRLESWQVRRLKTFPKNLRKVCT